MDDNGKRCRAGRAILGWSRIDLATRARVAVRTIARLEDHEARCRPVTLLRLSLAFAEAGVGFTKPAGAYARGDSEELVSVLFHGGP